MMEPFCFVCLKCKDVVYGRSMTETRLILIHIFLAPYPAAHFLRLSGCTSSLPQGLPQSLDPPVRRTALEAGRSHPPKATATAAPGGLAVGFSFCFWLYL